MREKHTAWESSRTIVSAPATSDDDASGCMIKLSPRASKLLVLSGHSGSRIVYMYVKLRGTVTKLWVFCVYLPHGARSLPSHEDTLRELERLCQTLPQRRDLIMVMGDLNAKLARNTQGYTGKFSPCAQIKQSVRCENTQFHANFMQARDLLAANTFFCPRSTNSEGSATYVAKKTGQANSLLDYCLISRRWRSCVKNCMRTTSWAPSLRRFGKGIKWDHAMQCSQSSSG